VTRDEISPLAIDEHASGNDESNLSRRAMMTRPWHPWHSERVLRCITCQAVHPLRDVIYRCGSCGDLLDVVFPRPTETGAALAATFRARRMSDNPIDRSGVWRFRELLPFYDNEAQIVT
jgi:hypothetical protein